MVLARAVCAGFLAALPAQAQDQVPSSARFHDGFYLRLAAGLGYLDGSQSTESNGAVAEAELSLTGMAPLVEVSLGGALSPGLIIGGGLFGSRVFTTKAAITATPNTPGAAEFRVEDGDVGSSTLALTCPFVNVYPDAGSSLNAVAGPCYALAEFGDSELHSGFGLNLGLGAEWFVHDDWSVGLLARFQYASVSDGGDDPITVIVPGALFTATYN